MRVVRELRSQRGAATVELVLVFPIFLAIVATILFAGWVGAVKGVLDHGVREGARYASIPCSEDLRAYPDDPRTTADSETGAQPASETDPCPGSPEVEEVVDRKTPMLTPTDVNVSGGGRNAPVTVTATYEVPNPFAWMLTPLELFGVDGPSSTLTLTSTAEGRRE